MCKAAQDDSVHAATAKAKRKRIPGVFIRAMMPSVRVSGF
jgi:hypothetical protein